MAAGPTDQLSALDKLLIPQLNAIRHAKAHECHCVEDVKSLLRVFLGELRTMYGLTPPSELQEHVREEYKDDEDATLVVDRQLSEEPDMTTVHLPSSLPIVEDDDDDEISHPGITCDSCQQALRGVRYKCNTCPVFNVCGNCECEQAAATRHGGELKHSFTEIADPTSIANPPPPTTPPKPPRYIPEPVEQRETISSMISRVLTQTSSNSSELPNIWSGVKHSPAVPTRPRGTMVLRYESGATLVTPSSGKHTPLDSVPIYDLAKPYDETCNKCHLELSEARYKCALCPSHELCPSCFHGSEANNSIHPFTHIPSKEGHLISRKQHHTTCNLCHQTIVGTCYKCLYPVCSSANITLCAACESDGGEMHHPDHPLLKLRTPDSWHPILGLGKPTCPSIAGSEEGRGTGVRRARGSVTPASSSSEGPSSLSGYGAPSWLGYGFHEAGLGLKPYGAAC